MSLEGYTRAASLARYPDQVMTISWLGNTLQGIQRNSIYLPDRCDLIITIQEIKDLTGSMPDLVQLRQGSPKINEDPTSLRHDLVHLRQALHMITKILHNLCLIWCD